MLYLTLARNSDWRIASSQNFSGEKRLCAISLDLKTYLSYRNLRYSVDRNPCKFSRLQGRRGRRSLHPLLSRRSTGAFCPLEIPIGFRPWASLHQVQALLFLIVAKNGTDEEGLRLRKSVRSVFQNRRGDLDGVWRTSREPLVGLISIPRSAPVDHS